MRAYVVRQGDHLAAIAARLGFDAGEVWQHDDNRELRELRGDGSVLAPGDVLYVPDEPAAAELRFSPNTTNRYQATVATTQLHLNLQGGGTQALANEPYRVTGLAEPLEGQSDGEGNVAIEVPAHVRELTLELPERDQAMVLDIGHLDPPEHTSGLRDRLLHLGYLIPIELVHGIGANAMSGDEMDLETADALRAFQRDRGLEPTGQADDDTLNALREAHV